MSKGMEALKYISNFSSFWNGYYADKLASIENELRAFEIIKEHGVDVAELMICQDYARYEAWFCENVKGRVKLNEEEFNFLKKVLS